MADPRLDALRDLLTSMRGKPPAEDKVRGASPKLTAAKHQLRDWIESRMSDFAIDGDPSELASRLSNELRQAGLLCGWDAKETQCPEWWQLGFLSKIEFRRSGGFLILITHTGIECGFDDSAYLYGWSPDDHWRRVWQTEQNTYTEKGYKPQSLQSVQISPYSQSNDYLILTLGSRPWCSSNWHPVYYRVFRPGPDPEAKPLVEGEDWAFISAPIEGSITTTDALIEFSISSVDGGVHNRKLIRHYQIDHDKVIRIDPLALSPRDFVDEWLAHNWTPEVLRWTEQAARLNSRAWHEKLHKELVSGQFIYPTTHCKTSPDLWQVGIDFSDPPTPYDKPPVGTYFIVRWRPPYRFTMVRVSDRADPKCIEEDRDADEPRTLFPNH